MSVSKIMTPSEIQNAADNINYKKARAKQNFQGIVDNLFKERRPQIFNNINESLINTVVSHPDRNLISVQAINYDDAISYNKPFNVINSQETHQIIMEESTKHCTLLGEFIKAQGHNIVSAHATYSSSYGNKMVKCEFMFGDNTK